MLQQLIADTATGLQRIAEHELPLLQQPTEWQTKYRLLMQLGKNLPALPEKMRQVEYLVRGCESRAWLLHYQEPVSGKHYFVLDSEARIVKGLLAIMLCFVNGKTSAELAELDLSRHFDALNLRPYLSQSRGNGLTMMMQRIQSSIKA